MAIPMNIEIKRVENDYWSCACASCKHLPEYHHRFTAFGEVFRIKKGTICAMLTMGNTVEFYCTDCIGELYNYCKLKLNKDLWVFH